MVFTLTNTIGKYAKNPPGGGVTRQWVAVGDGSLIANSPDGNDWTEATTKGGITDGLSVAYGKDGSGAGRWVAVGGGGLIAYSPDGSNWTEAATQGATTKGGITSYGRGVAYGKDASGTGRWVAVGNGGLIAYSADGNNWTEAATQGATTKGGITTYGFGVAYGKDASGTGRWVAVGRGSLIAYSPDGNNWTAATTKGGISSQGQGVAYGKDGSGTGRWVAVGLGGRIAYSPDGNDWTAAATKGGITTQAFGVAYGKDGSGTGRWVAVGEGGVIAYSPDGNNWTAAATKGGITSQAYGVAFKELLEVNYL